MPEAVMIPEKDFEAQTDLYQESSLRDKSLSYELRLPKQWVKSREAKLNKDALSKKILSELSRFYGPPNGDIRSYFTVDAVQLEYKITAEQWLIQFLISNAYTPQGLRVIDEKKAEAVYLAADKDINYVVHALVLLNGRNVVFARYYVAESSFEAEGQSQAQTIASFRLTNVVEEEIEKLLEYHFLDISFFKYPDTWTLDTAPLKTADRMQAQLYNINADKISDERAPKDINGKIAVNYVSSYTLDSLSDETRRIRSDLQRAGLLIRSPVKGHADIEVNQKLHSQPLEVFEATDRNNDLIKYEFWMKAIEAEENYYFISLLTPAAEEDYASWSRNTETFKSIVKSLSIQEGSLVHESQDE